MGTNSSPGGEGVNKQTPIGQSQKSGNDWLGIDARVAGGTNGARPDVSARYGGDVAKGQFFKGNSVATDNKELNSGGDEKASSGSGQYGAGSPGWAAGGVGSRENMPKYGGDANKGKLVGDGAGATKDTNPNDQYKRDLPTQPGQDLVAGTNKDRDEYARDQKGIGKPGAKGARM